MPTMLAYQNGETREIEVADNKKNQPKLANEQAQKLAELAKKIEYHYQSPQDVAKVLAIITPIF